MLEEENASASAIYGRGGKTRLLCMQEGSAAKRSADGERKHGTAGYSHINMFKM